VSTDSTFDALEGASVDARSVALALGPGAEAAAAASGGAVGFAPDGPSAAWESAPLRRASVLLASLDVLLSLIPDSGARAP
jgi:hypothetical protein